MNSLGFKNSRIDRAIVIVTLLVSIVAVCFPNWINSDGKILTGVLILAIGVPHGAADAFIFKHSDFKDTNKAAQDRLINQKAAFSFYVPYILLAIFSILCWYWLPGIAVSVFIAVSAYHLGQSNLYSLSLPESKGLRLLIYSCWGIFVIVSPIVSNPEEVTQICNDFLGDCWITGLLHQNSVSVSLLVSILLLNLIIFSCLKQYRYLSRQAYLTEVVNLLVLAILFYTAPLIVSFGVYFALWHSLGSTLDQVKFMRQQDSSFNLKTFYWQTAPLTLLSIFLFVIAELILTHFKVYSSSATAVIGLFFVGLAAITLPHALIRDKLYRAYSGLLTSPF